MAEVQIIALVASERVEEKIYHLVGKGGETPADPRIAADVAEKLLELRAPAVCDLYEMKPSEQRRRSHHQQIVSKIKNLAADPYPATTKMLKAGRKATTNAVEGFFGNSKRSLDGTHHHISRKHTGLYLAELDHKYNTRKLTDGERTVIGIKGMEGKRLMLRFPKSGEATVLSEGI
jgi:hypothetical protein